MKNSDIRGGGGRGGKEVLIFSGNSSILARTGFPKIVMYAMQAPRCIDFVPQFS